jgi:hypothetical protein
MINPIDLAHKLRGIKPEPVKVGTNPDVNLGATLQWRLAIAAALTLIKTSEEDEFLRIVGTTWRELGRSGVSK